MWKMEWLAGLLALLLLFSLVFPSTGDASSETVAVFESGSTKINYKNGGDTINVRTPIAFRVPAFVGGVVNQKEFLAIICGAHFGNLSDNITVDGIIRTSYGNHNQWSEPEGFTNNTQGSTKHIFMGDFTAVMKEKKIYVLATSYNKTVTKTVTKEVSKEVPKKVTVKNKEKPHNPCIPVMFVGTVKDFTSSAGSGSSITWSEGKSLKDTLSKTVQGHQVTDIFGGMGNGIVTTNGSIVFPIRIFQKSEHITSSILYSIDNGETWTIGKMTENHTNDGSVVEWGDGKLLLIVSSSEGFRKVFESENMGNTWTESLILSRVWGNAPNRTAYIQQGSAIKVQVDGKDMLLIAHPLSKKDDPSPKTLQLWMSDGQRIVLLGTINKQDKEKKTGNSILAHVGDHLYATHEINPPEFSNLAGTTQKKGDGVIGLTHLPEFLQSATTTMRAWHKLDAKYKAKSVPIKALVGFLVNEKTDKTVWEDMYNCVHATVKGGKSVDGGFQFDGAAGSGAMWPVASQGQNQVYAFTKKQFTLTATVTIDAASEKAKGKLPLFGASLDSKGNNAIIGLGHTENNKWYAVNYDKKEIETAHVIESGKEYRVALTMAYGKVFLYVDGVDIAKGQITIPSEASISHFFIGGVGQSSPAATGNSCTVKNVMLFSRALGKEEMEKLLEVKVDATNETTKGQSAVQSLANRPNAALGKHIKRPDSATVSFCIMPFMCFVCSFIVLAGF